MKFKNLEMTGFKFSEKITVLIEKGLTELSDQMDVENQILLRLLDGVWVKTLPKV